MISTSSAHAGLVAFLGFQNKFTLIVMRGKMMVFRLNGFLLLSTMVFLVGCGGGRDVGKAELEAMAGKPLEETVPVSGTVTVGGSPAADVKIFAYTQSSGMDPVAEAKSASDGKYCFTTYAQCDGIPPGEYKIGFAQIPNEGKGKKAGEDLLGGKYRNPMKSGFDLTVQSGTPQEGVDFALESGG